MSRLGVGTCIFVISILLNATLPRRCEARCLAPGPSASDHDKDGAAEIAQSEVAAASSNIFIRKDLQPFVAKLLLFSPTFRRQFQRIRETPDVRVRISLVLPDGSLRYRARCIVEKVQGVAFVNMEIVALSSYAEMIGHEFEHLLEQVDGVNLQSLSAEKGSGVVRQWDGSFETTRAINAGQTVAHEYREHSHAR